MTPPTLPTRVAIHEAGHAVVMLSRGMTIDSVSVVSTEDEDFAGTVQMTDSQRDALWSILSTMAEPDRVALLADGVHPVEVAERVRSWPRLLDGLPVVTAASIVAGELAERIEFGSAEEYGLGGDKEFIAEMCRILGDEEEVRRFVLPRAYALAESILTERWPAVLALAAVLDERGTLMGEEVEELLRAFAV